jgi:hypothetical protein
MLRNKRTDETWQVLCTYEEMKKRLSDEVELVLSTPKFVSGVGNLHSKVPDGFKDRLGQIKKTSGRGNTIKL